jgi:hypothetical protein
MGKDVRPMRTRLYSIASDAVAKLQNMVKGGKFSRMAYAEVEMFLEKSVFDAVQQKHYEQIYDCTDRTKPREGLLVVLPQTVGKGLHAIVHDDLAWSHGKPRQIILAVLDTAMVEFNRQNGNWSTRSEPLRPMVSLGAKMPQGKLQALLEESQKRKELPPQLTSTPTYSPPPRMSEAELMDKVLRYKVTWTEEVEPARVGVEFPPVEMERFFTEKEEMQDYVSGLVTEGGADDVKIFKEVLRPTWLEMKKKVRIDLE